MSLKYTIKFFNLVCLIFSNPSSIIFWVFWYTFLTNIFLWFSSNIWFFVFCIFPFFLIFLFIWSPKISNNNWILKQHQLPKQALDRGDNFAAWVWFYDYYLVSFACKLFSVPQPSLSFLLRLSIFIEKLIFLKIILIQLNHLHHFQITIFALPL